VHVASNSSEQHTVTQLQELELGCDPEQLLLTAVSSAGTECWKLVMVWSTAVRACSSSGVECLAQSFVYSR
jgi:hypothetical protein